MTACPRRRPWLVAVSDRARLCRRGRPAGVGRRPAAGPGGRGCGRRRLGLSGARARSRRPRAARGGRASLRSAARGLRVLVNDRADVAAAAGVGVASTQRLDAGGAAPPWLPPGTWMMRAVHDVDDVATAGPVDAVVAGTVRASASKPAGTRCSGSPGSPPSSPRLRFRSSPSVAFAPSTGRRSAAGARRAGRRSACSCRRRGESVARRCAAPSPTWLPSLTRPAVGLLTSPVRAHTGFSHGSGNSRRLRRGAAPSSRGGPPNAARGGRRNQARHPDAGGAGAQSRREIAAGDFPPSCRAVLRPRSRARPRRHAAGVPDPAPGCAAAPRTHRRPGGRRRRRARRAPRRSAHRRCPDSALAASCCCWRRER